MAAISEPDSSGIIKVSGAGRIQRKELPVFSRLMAAMLYAGMPVVQVLDALEGETADPTFRAVLGGINTRIESGDPTVLGNFRLIAFDRDSHGLNSLPTHGSGRRSRGCRAVAGLR